MTRILYYTISVLARLQKSLKVLISRLCNKFIKRTLTDPNNQKLYRKMLLPVVERDLISASFELYLKKKGLTPSDSFKALIRFNRGKSNSSDRIEWKLNNKITGSRFASRFGLDVPEMYQFHIPFRDINFRENVVLKPVSSSGSAGAYIFHHGNKIWDIKNQREISDIKALTATVEGLLRNNTFKDSWIVEEYISSSNGVPQRDFKFYTFYGKVAMIQETEIIPELRYCYWDRQLNLLQNVRTDESKSFVGDGLDPDFIKRVESFSLEIPTSFIRIDFLSSNGKFYFNEFAPSPGSHNKFRKEIDEMLGKAYIAAEGRLYEDHLALKSFEFVKEFLGSQAKANV